MGLVRLPLLGVNQFHETITEGKSTNAFFTLDIGYLQADGGRPAYLCPPPAAGSLYKPSVTRGGKLAVVAKALSSWIARGLRKMLGNSVSHCAVVGR